MSYHDDWYEPDPFDDDEDGRLVECKRCGEAGLHWEEEDGRYVLCHQNGRVHTCDAKRLERALLADLEDLS